LDINLPRGSGLELLDILKKEKIEGSVVIVSANNTLDDKVEGLELGADDYLTKPFHLSELNARVKAVLRRNSYQGSSEITVNEIKINPESKMVWINEKSITLTKKEYLLLEFFIINKDKVLSKESISEHLWGDYMDQSDSFDFIYSHLKNLRKKLVANGAKDYVKTVYGIGYIFNTL
jgi:DNA-binding response OmpR family regulator